MVTKLSKRKKNVEPAIWTVREVAEYLRISEAKVYRMVKEPVTTPGEGVVSLNEPSVHHDDPGTVKPPPSKVTICKKGVYSLGGKATLKVAKLTKSYCLKAYLQKRPRAYGKVPNGAGKILSDIA